jgi:hypothetical protein
MATRQRRRRSSRMPDWVQGLDLHLSRRQVVLAVIATVVVAALALFAWEAYRAVGALKKANDQANVLKQNIVEGDVPAARVNLKRFDESSTRARKNTDGPLWWLGAHVPVLGRNVDAVHTVARELDQVSDEVLPGIVDVADKVRLETFRPDNGKIDLKAVAEAAPVLVKADQVFADADRDVGEVDAEGLISPLQTPMAALQAIFHATATAASAGHDAADLMPTMLGADGKKRTYLLLILNNAEVRSLVGMPGSYAVITAQNGKIKMGRQGSGQDVGLLKKPVVKLTEDEKRVFQSSVAIDPRDTAAIPDFPRAAELAASIVGTKWKEKFDGVIGVDPITMAYMLRGLGPINVGDNVTINSRNAVQTLLNGVYLKYPKDPGKQDDVFKAAARRIFNATVSGKGKSQTVIRALVQGTTERRLMLWSRHDDLQKQILTSGIANALDRQNGRPQVGVYVDDAGSTKMQFYLGMRTTVRSEKCLDGDAQELRVTTTLASNTPASARRLPPSVTGFSRFVVPGNQLLGVTIYGPRGGDITTMVVDGQRAPVGGAELKGRPVAGVTRELPPGQSSVIITTMRTAAASPGDVELRTTPGVLPSDDSAESSACD